MTAVEEKGPMISRGASVWATRTMIVLGIILACRVVSLWFNNTELFFDEAQYWVWGNEPAFGYFSKPPLLAWIIGLTTAVFGDSEFAIRLPSPFLHTATAAMVFLCARRLFDSRTGFWAALTYALLPAVTLSSELISTDVPLLFFWSAALLAFLELEENDSRPAAVMLGLALGFGLMAKYAMIYFFICVVIYSLGVRERPHILGRRNFWIAAGIGLLILLPNLVWNAMNRFATVGHTGENIGWGHGFPNFSGLGEFLASQFGVMGPLLFGIYLAALFRLPREGMNRQQWFLIAFSAPILAIICFQALMSKAYANWAALTYVAGTILVADLIANRIPDWWLKASTGLHALVFAVFSVVVAFSQPGQLPLPEDVRPFERTQGSTEIAGEARAMLAKEQYSAILVDDRRMASLMSYYLRDARLPVLSWRSGEAPRDHFEMTRPYQENPLMPALYMTRQRNPAGVISSFGDAEYVGEILPTAGEIAHIWFYRLRDYRAQQD